MPWKLMIVSLLLGGAALLPHDARSAQILVDVNGGGDFITIQEGLNAAAERDSVIVWPGVYSGPLNRDLNFMGKDIVLVSQAGAAATVIECDQESRAFLFESGETSAAVVQGFTIRNGMAGQGGGINCLNASSPSIRECVILGCAAFDGGGINCDGGSDAIIEDCLFEFNHAEAGGGGIRCTGASAPGIERCTLTYNESTYGGGMITKGGSAPKLEDVLFEANTAEYSGGMRFEDGPAILTRVTFRSNHATYSGGAMGSGLGGFPQLSDCVVINNRADTRGGGYANGTQASITRCTFAGNRASKGGAFFCGPPEGVMVVTNTIIAMSTQGVAVYCEEPGGAPVITHCCVYGNAGGDVLCGTYYDNIFENPLFCDYPTWDLTLDAESPCLPVNNVWGEQIGACGLGCGGPVAAERASWGAIKAMFR